LDSCRFDALMSRYIVYNGYSSDPAPKCFQIRIPYYRYSTDTASKCFLRKISCFFVSHIVSRILESIRSSTALRNNHYINEQELEDNIEVFGKTT